jgi:hypothetical protein
MGSNSSVNDDILALAVYNNTLYTAGRFTSIGGNGVNRIAAWNGTSWVSLGLGLNEHAHGLAVYAGELVVCGNFTSAGGVSANRIARWNGSSWSSLQLAALQLTV